MKHYTEVGANLIALQIELQNGYAGTQPAKVSIRVCLVTGDQPYGLHPHQLDGRNCKNGVFTTTVELHGGQATVQ